MLAKRFRRITTSGLWIPEIDGLRFVAIFSVLLFHIAGELSARSGRLVPLQANYWVLERLLQGCERGVPLFFLISGMILALPFARHLLLGAKPVSLRRYYLRRLTRLEPPYVLSILLIIFLLYVYQHGLPAGYGSHVLATLFYQHNLVFGEFSTVNGVTWSLEVEVQFYILAPIVMQCYRVRRKGLRRTLLLVAALGSSLARISFPAGPRIHLSILFFLQYFLMGLLVADVIVTDLETIRSSWLWDLAAIAALSCMFFAPNEGSWPAVVMPLTFAILCLAAFRSVGLRRVLTNQWVAVTGGMCYSIYLLHFAFIAALFKATKHAILPDATFFVNYVIQVALLAVPVTAMCALFFLLVERPCMDPDWPSKLYRRLSRRGGNEVEVRGAREISV